MVMVRRRCFRKISFVIDRSGYVNSGVNFLAHLETTFELKHFENETLKRLV